MRNILAALFALTVCAEATAATAQTSKYGIPTTHAPYSGAIQLPSSTVATLPLCDNFNAGTLRTVTDAAASPAWNATATGGGSLKIVVMCNGSNWTYH